jgi:ribosomal protein S27AE
MSWKSSTASPRGPSFCNPIAWVSNLNTDQKLNLNCPKCAASVRAAANLAGKRVKCPKCGSTIKVPGAAPVAGDDDDWLSLDQPLKPDTPDNRSAPLPDLVASSSSAGNHWLDDLPELAPVNETPSSDPFGGLPAFNAGDFNAGEMEALSSAGGFGGTHFGDAAASGEEIVPAEVLTTNDVVTEYRAKCPVCESIHYVKPNQQGKEISCGDCYSRFIVPPPPKPVVKKKVDIQRAATFQLADVDAKQATYAGIEAKSAAEYLRKAEDEDIEEDPNKEYETPQIGAWLRSMFGVFLDPSVLAYWAALSVLGAILSVLTVAIASPIVSIGAGVLGIVYIALVIACGFAILESAAGGEGKVSEWPVFDPAEWLGQCLFAVAALVVSAFPGAFLGYFLFSLGYGLLATTLISIFALFPFVLMSMLDNGSVFMPISAEVTKSITRCKESWGGLYFSSMILFFVYFVLVAMLGTLPSVAAAFFDCFLSVGLIFVYFSMVGGLAFQIGQAVNGRDELPAD